MLAAGQRRGLLDANNIVLEPEVGIEIGGRLIVPGDDARAVRELENATVGRELMRQPTEQPATQVIEVFQIRFADLAEQKTFQPRHPLAIVRAHLREQPVRFAAAARPAVADRRRPVGLVAEPRRRAGHKLPQLENDARAREVPHLFLRTTGPACSGQILLEFRGLGRLV